MSERYEMLEQKALLSKGYWAAYHDPKTGWGCVPADSPVNPMTNAERSELETIHFSAGEDSEWFGYPAGAVLPDTVGMNQIATFMGDTLAHVSYVGHVYESGFGGKRQNFRAWGIDGREWYGTRYMGRGDYVRMRVVKRQRRG